MRGQPTFASFADIGGAALTLAEAGRKVGQLGLPAPKPDPDDLVDKFMKDIHAVCRHHGMTIHPQDDGPLVIERLDRGDTNDHMRDALVGSSIDEGKGQ